ncbi:DUF4232 domain-containing protein [Brevundimonas sp. SORGH_AS_0993]|uniref:DUF4232 domain-containing protein n=1 Tax=Brevundimonas sp. SORGH_AS_0993 TaxID=3041794 RepID=UPI0027866BE1|nr:DUF4232 domain-containing protein [Brevundimonas sp. SORGH_AS_0993]MDQ1154053.1 membrane-bound inhibitor of C-type lysozyme [Brevundimonas sp. SORGH_AS_0993]
MHRRLTAFVAIAALSATAACQQNAPESAAAPAPPAAATAADVAAVVYACQSGQLIQARYPDKTAARLTYKGQDFVLRATPAASGARYVGQGVEWATSAAETQETGTLSLLSPDQSTALAVVEQCVRPLATVGMPPVAPGGAPTPASAADDIPACLAPQLKLAPGEGDAGAGNRVLNFSLQNQGRGACRLDGYPMVALADARGRTIGSIRVDQSPGSYFRQGEAPRPVTLPSQARAYFEVAWNVIPNEAMGQTACPQAHTLKATVPGDTAALSAPFEAQPCGGKIRVSPIRSASAVPPTS